MNHKTAVKSSDQICEMEQQRPDCGSPEQVPSAHEQLHTPSKKVHSRNKILDYLLFGHGVESGVIAWVSCIAALLNVIWAIQGFHTTSTVSDASLTQTTLANQISFLKLCLEYPQLGLKSSNSRRLEPLLQKVPCDTFLRALDFDAVTQALIYPKVISDVQTPSPQDDLYIGSDFDHWRDVNTISHALTSRKLVPDSKSSLQRKARDKNDSKHDDEFGLNNDSAEKNPKPPSKATIGGTLLKYMFVAAFLCIPLRFLGFSPSLGASTSTSEPVKDETTHADKSVEDSESESESDSDFEE